MRIYKTKHLIPAPEDGANGVNYEIVPSVTCIHADKDGNITTGDIKVAAYRTEAGVRKSVLSLVYINSSYWVQYKIDSNSWVNCSRLYTFVPGGGLVPNEYGVPVSAVSDITSGIAFRLVYGTSSSYTTVYEMGALPVVQDGQTGAAGAVGKFYYPAGEFDDETEYRSSSNRAPYVYITEVINNQTKSYYYMLVASTNLVNGDLVAPGEDSSIWELMENDFKYLISEAIFTMFGKMGAAVYCGDWCISQYGTLGGSESTQYHLFDPAYPDKSVDTTHTVNGETWSGYNFVPNYAVDLLHGKPYMQTAVINGLINAKLFYSPTLEITADTTIDPLTHQAGCYILSPSPAGITITLPIATDYDGLELNFYVPYGSRATGSAFVQVQDSDTAIAYQQYYIIKEAQYSYIAPQAETLLLHERKVFLHYNNMVKFKSMLGRWYVISGMVMNYAEA